MPARQDLPVEVEGTPAGQLVVAPPSRPVPARQRLVWLRTLLKSPKALTGIAIVGLFILVALFCSSWWPSLPRLSRPATRPSS
jgi:hypothetical protein